LRDGKICKETCGTGTAHHTAGPNSHWIRKLLEGCRMMIEPPVLPYNFADLEPVLSRDTLMFHFLRHQRLCFDRLQALVRDTELAELSLEQVIRRTERTPAEHDVFRLAAEVWNHNLFWQSMRPRGGGSAHGEVADHIRRRFGSHEGFTREFRAAANSHFGSGSIWLVWRKDAVQIVSTGNAGTPLVRGDVALIGLDLWEHAFYLDFQNRRAAYVNGFLEELVNWDCANRILGELSAAQRSPRRVELVQRSAL
jgi:superoxide dismutase, Fe-Mn family